MLLVANRELAAIGAIGLVAYGLVSWRSSRRLDAELDPSHIRQVVAGIKTVQTHGNEAHEAETLDRLTGVSFHLRSGERTALVGPSGAGKTTVSDLLVELYAPQTGRIVLEGQDIAAVAPWSLRHAVRGVAADGTLFRMSIRDNIRYGRLDATDADVAAAATLAGLDGVVERLDDGLDTLVGERGVELSVGERQRLLLARAFLARPSVLVLDEATANLDFRTEASVKEALAELSRGRTTLLIARRRSMVTDVDRAIVLRDGRIEQDGSPLELLNRPGYFQDMLRASDNA